MFDVCGISISKKYHIFIFVKYFQTSHWLSSDVVMKVESPLLASVVSTKEDDQDDNVQQLKPFNSECKLS